MIGDSTGPMRRPLMDKHHLALPDQPPGVGPYGAQLRPCMACAAHVFGPAGEEVVRVKIADGR